MTTGLRERLRAELPRHILSMMDEIEAFAGMPIAVAINNGPVEPNTINPNALATAVSHEDATIFVRSIDNIDAHGVCHELLHIRRYWVEGVLQIHPLAPNAASDKFCATIENELEHSVIVPLERKLGFEEASTAYWNRVARGKWERYPRPDISDPVGRRNNALLGRLSLELVTDLEIRDLAFEALKKENLTEEAERFVVRMGEFRSDKRRLAACAARFLKAPVDRLRLIYFDVRKRQHRSEALPSR